jgi:hypothetical protein
MADPQAFSVMRAARDLRGRNEQVDGAVAAAQAPAAAPASNLQAGRERAMNMGGAPTGSKQQHYGAPIQQPDGSYHDGNAQPAAPVEEQPPQLVEDDVGTIGGVARRAREQARRQTSNITVGEPATEEDQAEYQRATDMLSRVLYEDMKTSTAVIDALQPENKVGSVAQAAMLVMKSLDEKADLDENVIPQMTMDVVDRLIDLGEQTKGMQFSDDEAKNALGAAWEGVMQMYGEGDANDFAEMTQDMSDEELKGQTDSYKQFLGSDF